MSEEWYVSSEDGTNAVEEPASNSETNTPPKGAQRKSPTTSKSLHGRKTAPQRYASPKPWQISHADWSAGISSISYFVLSYVLEVLRFALVVLRKPLSLILVGYLLAIMASHLRETIGTAMMCQLPLISRLAFCRVARPQELVQMGVQRADYPSLVDIETTTFEQLLDNSIGGAGLALEIKKAEMATVDLVTLVRVSHLQSKDKLSDALNTFVEDARRTGRGLQKFSAKVGGAVDRIIAVNDYALKRIERAASESSYPSLWRAVLSPFSLQPSYRHALTSSFNQAMSMLESEIHALILSAETSLHDLDTLEEQLHLVHSMVVREDDSIKTSKDDLLSKLWTVLGGNRAELRRFDTHLSLLNGLTEYRKKALAHVVGALQTLQTMSADLEALRERVSEPLLSADEAVPLDVHVKSIRIGLDRMTEGRWRAKKVEDARYAKIAESVGVGS